MPAQLRATLLRAHLRPPPVALHGRRRVQVGAGRGRGGGGGRREVVAEGRGRHRDVAGARLGGVGAGYRRLTVGRSDAGRGRCPFGGEWHRRQGRTPRGHHGGAVRGVTALRARVVRLVPRRSDAEQQRAGDRRAVRARPRDVHAGELAGLHGRQG